PGCNNASLDNDADHLLAWAAGGTTGISNLGQPCPRHHKLKHGSAWTPSGASKDKPPGWTSPSGRYYPSEQQDWEPPHWPNHLLTTDTDMEADMDGDALLDQDLPMDPGPDPDQELPQDPFPDWTEPLVDTYPESVLRHVA
ncbi:HNH endonuclease signature motif containing protein, partial [Arthrobacter sp. SO3]|uniref:HNH endonuclease signature motif containing protein n=1 Tax=Arthrobacter sp. SO3 TaxID=1897057 RepID=UPI001CFFAC2A